MLLEELAKHQDWIQDSSLSENLNLSVEELQEHLFKLEQLFPNLLIRSRKKGIQLQFDLQNSLDPQIAIFEQSATTLFELSVFKEGNHLTKCARRFRLIQSRLRKSSIVSTLNFHNTMASVSNLPFGLGRSRRRHPRLLSRLL